MHLFAEAHFASRFQIDIRLTACKQSDCVCVHVVFIGQLCKHQNWTKTCLCKRQYTMDGLVRFKRVQRPMHRTRKILNNELHTSVVWYMFESERVCFEAAMARMTAQIVYRVEWMQPASQLNLLNIGPIENCAPAHVCILRQAQGITSFAVLNGCAASNAPMYEHMLIY